MAEVLGLLASIAGVSTAGINVATHLYSITRLFKGLEDEIKSVAREIETLSSVFEEISTTLQLGNEGSSTPITKLNVSRSAIVTLSDLVQDSQSLYEKIAQTVSDQSNLKGVSAPIFYKFGDKIMRLSDCGSSASQVALPAGRRRDMECKAIEKCIASDPYDDYSSVGRKASHSICTGSIERGTPSG